MYAAAKPKYAPNKWMKMVPPMSRVPNILMHRTSLLNEYKGTSRNVIKANCDGEIFPIKAPNEINTAAAAKLPCKRALMLSVMGSHNVELPSTTPGYSPMFPAALAKKRPVKTAHGIQIVVTKKVIPTAVNGFNFWGGGGVKEKGLDRLD